MSAMLGAPQNMACHVAQRATAEIEESAPCEGRVRRAVGPHALNAEPRIPIERLRHRRLGRRIREPLRPDGAVGPGVYLGDVADLAAKIISAQRRVPSLEYP